MSLDDLQLVVLISFDCRPSLAREVRGGNAGPLRCGKGTTWEGGQRVPAIARWPGKIASGKTHEVGCQHTYTGINFHVVCFVTGFVTHAQQLAATLDLLPTILKISGLKQPTIPLDGFDMSPILFTNSTVSSAP